MADTIDQKEQIPDGTMGQIPIILAASVLDFSCIAPGYTPLSIYVAQANQA